jgi:hypothetical protein
MPELSASGTGVSPVILLFHATMRFLKLLLGQDARATFSQTNPLPILKSSLRRVVENIPYRVTKVRFIAD